MKHTFGNSFWGMYNRRDGRAGASPKAVAADGSIARIFLRSSDLSRASSCRNRTSGVFAREPSGP